MLGGQTTFPYRRAPLAAYEPTVDTVADAPKPVALMAGVAEGSTVFTGERLRAAGDGWGVAAAARTEDGHAYRDGAGAKVNFGYGRDTEWLGARWGKPDGTLATVSVVRDAVADAKLPNYGLDLDYMDQGGARATLETVTLPGWFNHAGGMAAFGYAHVDADNYTLRQPGALLIQGVGDQQSWRAHGWAAHDEAGRRTLFGIEATRIEHSAKRYDRPESITAYWAPDVETLRASTWVEHTAILGETRLQGAVRYDLVSMSAADLHKHTTTSSPLFNYTSQDLYDRYYGANGDNDNLDHNLSGRLRAERNLTPDAMAYADLAHLVRSPDHTERYNANGGPAALTEVGNPQLAPEKHNRATLGSVVSGGGYKGYGRASSAGAWRVDGNAYLDRVEDFVTIDWARGQPGVLVNTGGMVYRNVDATITGLSADLQRVLSDHLAVRLNLTGQRGRNLTDHRPLYQMAPFEAILFIDTYGGEPDLGWNAGSRLRAVAAKRAVDSSITTGSGMDTAGPAGGFAVLDLYAGMNFGDSLALSVGVDNVFDKLYREHLKATPNNSAGVMPNAPGRTFVARMLVTY
ncbi:MAG TPA: TonB-dependent receptor [Magnetospirillum sp.]|nr:TonB-dependent receptor [Magnetospirillum sp.]